MRKHVIIIALIWLVIGITGGLSFIIGHIYFLSISSTLFVEPSVLDTNLSFLQKWGENFNVYMDFFAEYDINPLISLMTIIRSIIFGYGLLKSKEWARKLGFLMIAIDFLASIHGMVQVRTSILFILQIVLCGYMWWILTSPETIQLFRGESFQGIDN